METTETGTRRVMDLPALQRVVKEDQALVDALVEAMTAAATTESNQHVFLSQEAALAICKAIADRDETVGALLGEVERLTREAKERYERYNAPAMLALHNLTPGGSEFAGDPDACAAYVRRRFNDEHEAQKKLARQAKELARLRRVEAAAKAAVNLPGAGTLRVLRDALTGAPPARSGEG